MSFVKVAALSDIPPGQMKAVKVDGKNVLVANVQGSFHALNNTCNHAHASLAKGKLEGCVVTCPLHHAQFDVTNGKNLADAKVLFLNMKVKDAQCYKVQVEGNDVLVSIE